MTDPLQVRRRTLPSRVIGDRIVVARPADGAPVVLGPTVSCLWTRLESWSSERDLDQVLERNYPSVSASERIAARSDALSSLRSDDLIERR